MHKNGVQGALRALKEPSDPKSKAKFKEVKMLMNRKPKNKEKNVEPANNLLELLED
jgi:hypothetical protein